MRIKLYKGLFNQVCGQLTLVDCISTHFSGFEEQYGLLKYKMCISSHFLCGGDVKGVYVALSDDFIQYVFSYVVHNLIEYRYISL